MVAGEDWLPRKFGLQGSSAVQEAWPCNKARAPGSSTAQDVWPPRNPSGAGLRRAQEASPAAQCGRRRRLFLRNGGRPQRRFTASLYCKVDMTFILASKGAKLPGELSFLGSQTSWAGCLGDSKILATWHRLLGHMSTWARYSGAPAI